VARPFPPFDDPRWITFADALRLLAPRSGSLDLAAHDLNRALTREDEPARCKARPVRGDRPEEEVPFGLWAYAEVWRDGSVNERPPSPLPRPGYRIVRQIPWFVFFVFGPDLDLPTPEAEEDSGVGYKEKALISYIKENYAKRSRAEILKEAGGIDGLRTKLKKEKGLDISRPTVFNALNKLFGSKSKSLK
jgi:hypothetical protein